MRLGKISLNGLLGAIILTAGLAAPMSSASDKTSADEQTVEIRIVLPDGRVVIQKAPKNAARHTAAPAKRRTKRLADGSRVSVGSATGTRGSRRTSGARAARPATSVSAKPSTQSPSIVVQSRPSSEGTSGHNSSLDQGPESTDSAKPELSVPTIGSARVTGDDAFGGQSFSFEEIGMYGAVIGNTLFLVGVEVAYADQSFDVARGTRIGTEMAMKGEAVAPRNGADAERFGNGTTMKLSFESGTVLTLVMLSDTGEEGDEREERTWTVRIR